MTGHMVHIPVLETERLRLRAQRVEDFDAFAGFLCASRSRYVGGPVKDLASLRRIFGHVAGQWVLRGYGSFVMERRADAAPIGLCGLWNPIGWPEPEIGWSLWDPTAEGQGLAFEGVVAARDYAFETVGLDTAVSYINADNARSIALAERLGALRDDDAERPDAGGLVYRHPREAAA